MNIHRRHIGRKRGAALKKRREKNAENGELGRSIILLLLSLFLLCGITLAWFTMNRAAGSGGPVLGAKIPYIPFTLYRLTEQAAEGENTVVIGGRVYGWTQVQDIDFSEAVPNRADRYLEHAGPGVIDVCIANSTPVPPEIMEPAAPRCWIFCTFGSRLPPIPS